MATRRKPKLAVFKFASCDGCQLTLLDMEDQLLALAGAVEIAEFAEASRSRSRGPYDLTLVEGSITTPHDAERIHEIRRASKTLVAIGACATAGGIQALRNYAEVREWIPMVYARPEHIETLRTSTPIANHVPVDFELNGCPVSKSQLLEVVTAFLHGRRPVLASTSVCAECKRRGTPCVSVARGIPCLGPVVRSGCGALCPAWGRGCFGCFGPLRGAPLEALAPAWRALGAGDADLVRALRNFNAAAEAFRKASDRHEPVRTA